MTAAFAAAALAEPALAGAEREEREDGQHNRTQSRTANMSHAEGDGIKPQNAHGNSPTPPSTPPTMTPMGGEEAVDGEASLANGLGGGGGGVGSNTGTGGLGGIGGRGEVRVYSW